MDNNDKHVSILVEFLCSKYMKKFCDEDSTTRILELQRSSQEEGIEKEKFHEIFQDILSELILQVDSSLEDLTGDALLYCSWEDIDEKIQKEWFFLLSDFLIVLSSENFTSTRFTIGESPTYYTNITIILYHFSIVLSQLVLSKPVNDYLIQNNHDYENLLDFHTRTISSFRDYLVRTKSVYLGLEIKLGDPYQSTYFLTIGHMIAMFSESDFDLSDKQPISIQDQIGGAGCKYLTRFTSGVEKSMMMQLFLESEETGLKLSIVNSILFRRINSISDYNILADHRTTILIRDLVKMGYEIIEDSKPRFDENEAEYNWGFDYGANLLGRFYDLVLISAPIINDNFRDVGIVINGIQRRITEYGQLFHYPQTKLLCSMIQNLAFLCQGNVGMQAYSEEIEKAALRTLGEYIAPEFNFVESHQNHLHPLFWFLVCARQVRDNTLNWIEKINDEKGLSIVKRHPRVVKDQEINYTVDQNYVAARFRHVSFYNQIGIPTKIRSGGKGRWIQTMFDHPNKKKKHQLEAEIANIPRSLQSSISSLERTSNIIKQPLTMLVILDHYIQLTRLIVTSGELNSTKGAIEELNKIIKQQGNRFSKRSHLAFSKICNHLVETWFDEEGNMDESDKKKAVRAQRELRRWWVDSDQDNGLESLDIHIKIPNFSFQGAFNKTERDIIQQTGKLSESYILSLSEKEYKNYAEQTIGKGRY